MHGGKDRLYSYSFCIFRRSMQYTTHHHHHSEESEVSGYSLVGNGSEHGIAKRSKLKFAGGVLFLFEIVLQMRLILNHPLFPCPSLLQTSYLKLGLCHSTGLCKAEIRASALSKQTNKHQRPPGIQVASSENCLSQTLTSKRSPLPARHHGQVPLARPIPTPRPGNCRGRHMSTD